MGEESQIKNQIMLIKLLLMLKKQFSNTNKLSAKDT